MPGDDPSLHVPPGGLESLKIVLACSPDFGHTSDQPDSPSAEGRP